MFAISIRTIAVLWTSFFICSGLGTGYLFFVWSETSLATAGLRSGLFVTVMAFVHLIGYRIYLGQSASTITHPVQQRLQRLKPHRQAILAQQLPVLLLAALLLDGGQGFRVCLTACVAHWLIIALVLTRPRQLLGRLDHGLMRWGFFPCLAIAIGITSLL